MKIYSAAAPNPRRVRIFLAEKNLDIETVDMDLMRGETQTDHFRSLNSLGKTPVCLGGVATEAPRNTF